MEGPYKSSGTYRKPAVLAFASMALFACMALMSFFLAVLGFSYALFHRDLYSGGETGSLSFIFALMAIFVNLQPYVRVIAGIVLLCWVYRAHKNLSALKVRGLEFTPGWAVAVFVIPLVNLVSPFSSCASSGTAATRRTRTITRIRAHGRGPRSSWAVCGAFL